jgi:hypothetical protein
VVSFVLAFLATARVFLRGRTDTALEVLALRQQVAVLKRRRPRPPLSVLDRLFWTVLRETWARWKDVLVIVKPETGRQVASRRVLALLALEVPVPRRAAGDR